MTRVPPPSPFSGARPAAGNQLATPVPSGFIGRYQVLEKIGEGGMGALYLARDPAIDRLVAIKLLRRGFDTEALRERFAREARAVGRLKHPNIVTIFDVGEHDGDPFIAMEFLAGETVGELIRHGAGLSLARRLKLLEELCDGLAYAHRAGLVHRDVKPANLMVDAEGVLKILDFGIVRIEESGMTQAGVLVGTINYMSPEQVLGTGVDHRSDIFAVGLVAYELLSGKQAFVGTMKDGLLRRIPNVEIEPLANVRPGLDPDVVAIVEKALQKSPEDRYQELAKMRNDLTRARQRIEVEEERAAVEAASAAAETALIAEEPTAPGVALTTPGRPGFGLIADAERALAEGNYRFALTIAGRAAALDPHDRTPSTIVARAEAGLLERGRTSEGSQPGTPLGSAPRGALSSGAPAQAASGPGTIAQSQRATYLAIGVAVVALMVAAFAVWSQVTSPEPAVEPASRAGQAEGSSVDPGATEPSQSPPAPVSQPAGGDGPPQSAADEKSAATQAEPPKTSEAAPAANPASASRQENTRTPARQPTRSDSRREDAGAGRRPTNAAAPRVERERNAAPPGTGPGTGQPARTGEATPPAVTRVPLTEPAAPPTTLPGAAAPRPTTPPLPPPAKPVDKAPEKKPEPPRRDPRVEAEAGVRTALQRYEAAWEALDFNALKRVHVGADPRIAGNMRDTRNFEMEVNVQSVTVSADARTATVVCQISYRVQPRIGNRQTENRRSTFSFEKLGETWVITSIR
jgi:serine/threonine-protein kinase